MDIWLGSLNPRYSFLLFPQILIPLVLNSQTVETPSTTGAGFLTCGVRATMKGRPGERCWECPLPPKWLNKKAIVPFWKDRAVACQHQEHGRHRAVIPFASSCDSPVWLAQMTDGPWGMAVGSQMSTVIQVPASAPARLHY